MKKHASKSKFKHFAAGAALALLVVAAAPAGASYFAQVIGGDPGVGGGQQGGSQMGGQQGGSQMGGQQGGSQMGGQQGGSQMGGQQGGSQMGGQQGGSQMGGQSKGGQQGGSQMGGQSKGGQQGGSQKGGSTGSQQGQSGQSKGGAFPGGGATDGEFPGGGATGGKFPGGTGVKGGESDFGGDFGGSEFGGEDSFGGDMGGTDDFSSVSKKGSQKGGKFSTGGQKQSQSGKSNFGGQSSFGGDFGGNEFGGEAGFGEDFDSGFESKSNSKQPSSSVFGKGTSYPTSGKSTFTSKKFDTSSVRSKVTKKVTTIEEEDVASDDVDYTQDIAKAEKNITAALKLKSWNKTVEKLLKNLSGLEEIATSEGLECEDDADLLSDWVASYQEGEKFSKQDKKDFKKTVKAYTSCVKEGYADLTSDDSE